MTLSDGIDTENLATEVVIERLDGDVERQMLRVGESLSIREDGPIAIDIQMVEAPEPVTREDFTSVIGELLHEGNEETAHKVAETIGIEIPDDILKD